MTGGVSLVMAFLLGVTSYRKFLYRNSLRRDQSPSRVASAEQHASEAE
jgi:hypothetical protein